MGDRHNRIAEPLSRRLNDIGIHARRTAESLLRSDRSSAQNLYSDLQEDDDRLAPVMPAIDAVQLLAEQEGRDSSHKSESQRTSRNSSMIFQPSNNLARSESSTSPITTPTPSTSRQAEYLVESNPQQAYYGVEEHPSRRKLNLSHEATSSPRSEQDSSERGVVCDLDGNVSPTRIRHNPFSNFARASPGRKSSDDYEFIPKSVILNVYSNDPEVKRFLKQLTKIATEFGYNEQDYKCHACRRPIGLVFGQSRLCHYDGHHYCNECHLDERSVIPARVLCNWDFNKYPISKRNQHFLTLIFNEPIFDVKIIANQLYSVSPELGEIRKLRSQAFFIRLYCSTCVSESVSLELTKLVWPREHLIKQTDLFSLDDLLQVKSGALKLVVKNAITFGRQHVLSCVLCCQKGFICELCKSPQIIYPFDLDTVFRCEVCQSLYHKGCFESKSSCDKCPRCRRLKARRNGPNQ